MQRKTSGAAGNGLCTTIGYMRCAAGIGLSATIMHLQRATSGAAGNELGATMKYLRRTTSAAAGSGPGITIKYLRGAAGIGLGTTNKYLVNQDSGAGSNWAKAHMHISWERIQMNPPVVYRLL